MDPVSDCPGYMDNSRALVPTSLSDGKDLKWLQKKHRDKMMVFRNVYKRGGHVPLLGL